MIRPVGELTRRPGWLLAAAALTLHLYASGGYGYFRDELYFIVCGERLDWGYVDQPPLIPLIAAIMHRLFAPSLVMLRLVPALAHAGTVALAAESARLLGGGRWAQAIAGLATLVAGVLLGIGTILTTNALEPLAWLACGYILIRIVREGDRRWWFVLGAITGVALLAKYTIAIWLASLGLGLLATRARRVLMRPEPYLAAALAGLIVLPNILWQAAHDWPFLEIARNAAETKNVALSPVAFLRTQAMMLNPATAPLWLAGFVAFAIWPRLADLRWVAVAVAALMAAMLALHGRDYYTAGAYPLLFAGGGVALEAWIASRAARWGYVAVVVLLGLIAAPFSLPILPIEQFARYQEYLGVTPQISEHRALGRLPQHYADMFGWRELAALVGRAYDSLPPDEQRQAVFLARNYGEAAAIDVFGESMPLPPAISGHNNYFLWGPRGHDGSVVIRLGGNRDQLLKAYASVEPAGTVEHPWAMPDETGLTLWICRGRKPPFDADWPSFKHYG
jgi:4-amino-4-deoxy-L-arabinose transferase-like glycosyltransferase